MIGVCTAGVDGQDENSLGGSRIFVIISMAGLDESSGE